MQFQTGIAGGDIADVLVVGSPLDFQLADEGAVLALDDQLDDSVKSDISEVLLNECIYAGSANPDMTGKIMSLPLYTGTRAIMYNKEIFDYFDVPYPTEQMTHAELLEMARKLTGDMDGKKVYGYGTTLFNMFANGEIAMFCGAVDYAIELVNAGWTEDKRGIAALPGETYATCFWRF